MELIDDFDGLVPSKKKSSTQPLINPLVSVFFISLKRASSAVCPCFLFVMLSYISLLLAKIYTKCKHVSGIKLLI